MANPRSADPSASLVGDLAALGRSQRSKVIVLVAAALAAVGLATSQAVDPGPAGAADDPGRALLLLNSSNGEEAAFIRRGGFQIERSTLEEATARAREELGIDDGHDIDAVRAWADQRGVGYILLHHEGPDDDTASEDEILHVALEALAHVEEDGDAARYLAIPVGDLREFGGPTVAPRRRAWFRNEGLEALEALLEQPLVRGDAKLHPMHEFASRTAAHFASGFKVVEQVDRLESQRAERLGALEKEWSTLQPMFESMTQGSYSTLRDGHQSHYAEFDLIAYNPDTLEVTGVSDQMWPRRGSLMGCDAMGPLGRVVSGDGRALVAGTHEDPELWRLQKVPDAKGCRWVKRAIGKPVRGEVLHSRGWLLHTPADSAPILSSLTQEAIPEVIWPRELSYGPGAWVEWGDKPMLAVAASPKEGGPYNYLLLWHPDFGKHPYQAGLDTLGLTQAFDGVHARPEHPNELLISSRDEGGAVYRLVLPRAAVEARLRYESQRVGLDEKEAAKLELPEMERPWLRATLLREEPFSELLVDYQGLRVATLADLPAGQSLRVVGIEEAEGVQLELPDVHLTRMVFDADGAGLVTHLELEAVPGTEIQVPRRLALPQSLHTRFLMRREALRQEAVEEVAPAPEPDAKDPEAGREIAP